MKRFWKYVTGVVPAYGLFPLVFSFVFNCLVYSGSRAIAGGWYHHNIESSAAPVCAAVFNCLFRLLYILGSELYSCGKAGEGTGLPFFYRRSYIPLRVPDHISGIPHHQHKTGDRGERFLGSAGRMALFH